MFGLEIDGRCVQIAAFAVALSAWKISGFQTLPAPHIAWVGAPPPLPRSEFVALANGDAELGEGLDKLWAVFDQAPLLGSLIEPTHGNLISPQRLGRIEPLLDRLVGKTRGAEPARAEGAIAARGMADAASLLSRRYDLVVTNVPFLTSNSFSDDLKTFVTSLFPHANADLATAMIARALRFSGVVASVSPHGWLYQVGHRHFRHDLVELGAVRFVADLGEGAFNTPQAAGAFVCLSVLAPLVKPEPETISKLRPPRSERAFGAPTG